MCYQPCHSWEIPNRFTAYLDFSLLITPPVPTTTGRVLRRRGQLIICQPTLLHHAQQLLSAQDSCTLPVWSEMSVFANATRLTSLTMSRHFEETTQSLIKNSHSVSYVQPFSLPFHQDLCLSFWNVSCWKKKNPCGTVWKTAAVLGSHKALKKAAVAGFKPRHNHVKQMKFDSTGLYSVIITIVRTTAK